MIGAAPLLLLSLVDKYYAGRTGSLTQVVVDHNAQFSLFPDDFGKLAVLDAEINSTQVPALNNVSSSAITRSDILQIPDGKNLVNSSGGKEIRRMSLVHTDPGHSGSRHEHRGPPSLVQADPGNKSSGDYHERQNSSQTSSSLTQSEDRGSVHLSHFSALVKQTLAGYEIALRKVKGTFELIGIDGEYFFLKVLGYAVVILIVGAAVLMFILKVLEYYEDAEHTEEDHTAQDPKGEGPQGEHKAKNLLEGLDVDSFSVATQLELKKISQASERTDMTLRGPLLKESMWEHQFQVLATACTGNMFMSKGAFGKLNPYTFRVYQEGHSESVVAGWKLGWWVPDDSKRRSKLQSKLNAPVDSIYMLDVLKLTPQAFKPSELTISYMQGDREGTSEIERTEAQIYMVFASVREREVWVELISGFVNHIRTVSKQMEI